MASAVRKAIGTTLRRLANRPPNGGAMDPVAPRARDSAILRAVIEHAPAGIAFITLDGRIRMENELLRRLRSIFVKGELHTWAEVARTVTWEDGRDIEAGEWERVFEDAHAKRVAVVLRTRLMGPSGPAFLENVLAPVHTDDGRLIGIVVIARDLSAERAIRKLREEVVAVITHDLRSPIAAILFSAEQALREALGPDGRAVVSAEVLRRIARSAQRLGGMVGQLLDASRVELATLALDRETIDVPPFLSQLVNDLAPTLRGHAVEADLPQHRVEARVDRPRLEQVLTNLLDNASKYSRDGSTIHLALREEGPTLHVSVSDQSDGIAAADLPNLFDRFYQAQRARRMKHGLGLGLYIARGIVEAHGGTLTVDTKQGVGSTFHVRLPRT